MAGPALFLLLFFLLIVIVAVVAVVLRVRTRDRRWEQWEQRPAARGLQAQAGDPLGLGPVLSAPGRRLTVERTVSGTSGGVPWRWSLRSAVPTGRTPGTSGPTSSASPG